MAPVRGDVHALWAVLEVPATARIAGVIAAMNSRTNALPMGSPHSRHSPRAVSDSQP